MFSTPLTGSFTCQTCGNRVRWLCASVMCWPHRVGVSVCHLAFIAALFQSLKIIRKSKLVTYRFYFFVGNIPKLFNFLKSMTKSYPVEFKIYRKTR